MENDKETEVTDDILGNGSDCWPSDVPNDNHKDNNAPTNGVLGVLRRGDLVRVSLL